MLKDDGKCLGQEKLIQDLTAQHKNAVLQYIQVCKASYGMIRQQYQIGLHLLL